MTVEGPMTALIDKLEKATKGSRELDYAIRRTLGYPSELMGRKIIEIRDQWPGVPVNVVTDDTVLHIGAFHIAQYTLSLDAAHSLVPEGCAWRVGCAIDFTPEATVYGHDIHVDVDAATPALALCSAALRARQGMDR